MLHHQIETVQLFETYNLKKQPFRWSCKVAFITKKVTENWQISRVKTKSIKVALNKEH